MEGDNPLDDEFLIEMLESMILDEFTKKDYIIYDQQIADVELTSSALKKTLARIMQTKSKSFNKKIQLILQDNRVDLLDQAFKRAKKKYKAHMTLRFMMFEQSEIGE
jgi:F0F1-type ATP synthase delta subunit